MAEWVELSAAQRTERMDFVVSNYARNGVVTQQGATMTTVRHGNEVNNVLHAILTLFTCGVWLVVWIALMIGTKPVKTTRIYVDEHGRVSTDDGPGGAWVERMPPVPSTA